MKYSEQISGFLNFLRDVQLEYAAAVDDEKTAGDQTQDILHTLELGENSYHANAKLAIALKSVRQERRRAKDRTQVLYPIADWARQNQRTVKELEHLLGDVRKAEKNTEFRHYNPKTDIVSRTLGGGGAL